LLIKPCSAVPVIQASSPASNPYLYTKLSKCGSS
jgi:hypothetical protein